MGKSVVIAPGFTDVELPVVVTIGGINGVPLSQAIAVGGFSSGQTAILTDAEFAALPTSITRALVTASTTTVAQPFRPSADSKATTVVTAGLTTGTVPLVTGYNILASVTGPVTLSLAATGWTAGSRSTVFVQITNNGTAVITQPTGVKWPAGTVPTATATNNKIDMYEYSSSDGGVTVFGRVMGQNF